MNFERKNEIMEDRLREFENKVLLLTQEVERLNKVLVLKL
jgi:hypothetical protein